MVECQLPKLKAAGSNPVSRSKEIKGLAQKLSPFSFSWEQTWEQREKTVPTFTSALVRDFHWTTKPGNRDDRNPCLVPARREKTAGKLVVWSDTIVMNTKAELDTAFEEYKNGTFIKQ